MKDQIFNIINTHFPNSNRDLNSWQSVLNNSSIVPSCFYLYNMVEYYKCYYNEFSSINLSFVIYINKEAVGVIPLLVHQNSKKQWFLSSNGTEIIEPLFIKSLARKVKRRLELELRDLILDLVKKLKIKKFQFANMNLRSLSDWYLMWTETANEIFSSHHIFVDLSLSLEEIHLKFRKSFRPLVNKGLRELNVEVHEEISDELFESFRNLHKEVAGRTTRSIESWQIQKEQISAKESFLIIVKSKSNSLIGGGLITYSKDCGFYSVGAYKREHTDKPIGHVVQMKAIETLKRNNVKLYEIGVKYLKIDRTKPDNKQMQISHFMEGFASNIMARQHLIVNLN